MAKLNINYCSHNFACKGSLAVVLSCRRSLAAHWGGKPSLGWEDPQILCQRDGFWQISLCHDDNMTADNHHLITEKAKQLARSGFNLWGRADTHSHTHTDLPIVFSLKNNRKMHALKHDWCLEQQRSQRHVILLYVCDSYQDSLVLETVWHFRKKMLNCIESKMWIFAPLICLHK